MYLLQYLGVISLMKWACQNLNIYYIICYILEKIALSVIFKKGTWNASTAVIEVITCKVNTKWCLVFWITNGPVKLLSQFESNKSYDSSVRLKYLLGKKFEKYSSPLNFRHCHYFNIIKKAGRFMCKHMLLLFPIRFFSVGLEIL